MATFLFADACITLNNILNHTATIVGNLLSIVFYIVFSPLICLLMLAYPEPAEPEELVELMESEEPEDPFEQSEESKRLERKIKNIRL